MRSFALLIATLLVVSARGPDALAQSGEPTEERTKVRTRAPAAEKAQKESSDKTRSSPSATATTRRRRAVRHTQKTPSTQARRRTAPRAPAHGKTVPSAQVRRKSAPSAQVRRKSAPRAQVRRRSPPAPRRTGRPVVRRFEQSRDRKGRSVVLHGANFAASTHVMLNGRRLKIIRRSPKQITVRIPSGTRSGNLVLRTAGLPDVRVGRRLELQRPPRIGRIWPPRVAAGGQLTIYGSDFAEGDTVQIGDTPARVLSLRPDRITVQLPARATRGRVGVRRGATVVWDRRTIDVPPPAPTIETLDVWQAEPGAVVRIRGNHFGRQDYVSLGNRRLTVRQRGPRFIEVVVPSGAASGHLTIRGPRGRRTRTSKPFTVLHPPRIRRLHPSRAAAGTTVTIYGSGFRASDKVLLGNARLQALSVGPNRISAKLPLAASRERVGIQRGQTVVWSRRPLVVLPPPPLIESLSVQRGAPGTVVRIRGRYFSPSDYVSFGGRRVVIRSRGADFIEVVVPKWASSGRFVVRGPGGRRVTTGSVFTVEQPARVHRFSPRSGAPGSTVRLSGSHFGPRDTVYLGERQLAVRSVNPRQIVAELPADCRTGRLSVRRGGTVSYARGDFVVRRPPRITSISATHGRPEARLSPHRARRGSEVSLLIRPPQAKLRVWLNGRRLPKKVLQGGRRIVVTVPGKAVSGYFEIEVNGRRVRAEPRLEVVR